MIALRVALGGAAGLTLGWLVWLAARRFAERYRWRDQAAAGADSGAFPPPAAAPVVFMTLWGVIVGWQADRLAVAALALVVTGLLLCITLVDLRVRRIPNPLVLALLACAVAQVLWLGRPDWRAAVLGMVVTGAFFLLLARIGRGAMGLGDVKLEAAVGALLGYPAALAAMAASIIAGGPAALFFLLAHRAGRKDPFPYGPYLALGAWLVLARLWGLWPGQ